MTSAHKGWMAPRFPAGQTTAWVALTLLVLAASEAVAIILLDTPPLQQFQPLVVVLALGIALVAGASSGTRAAAYAGALAGAYAVTVLVRFGGDSEAPLRLATGIIVGASIFAFALFVGWARAGHERLNLRLLDAERDRARALEARNHELATVNHVLHDFAHVVAHDLKEPVRGIDVLLEALAEDEGERLSPEGREILARARKADRRLAALVDALLDYARATRVQPDDLCPVDVRETLASDVCRARFANLAQERDARVIAPRPEEPPVLAAPNAMCLILGNLVSNAIRHNPSPKPLVRIRVEPAGAGRASVFVEDNGPGFSPDSIHRLEDVMSAKGPDRGFGRSGFGLLLVARAAERMGGSLHIGRSELGGAQVRVDLPTIHGADADAADEPPSRPERTATMDPGASGASALRRGVVRGGGPSVRPS